MKLISAILAALLLGATMSMAAVVQPTSPLPGYTSANNCDLSNIAHIDCIGMVTNTGTNPHANHSVKALNLNGFFGYTDWRQVDKYESSGSLTGVLSMTGFGTKSGTYSFTGMVGTMYALVVKGSDGFSAYLLSGSSASGALWDTLGLLNNGGNTPNISNLALYQVVPVPASLPLLLCGIAGFGFLRRRRRA